MKKYLWLILILIGFSFDYKVMADEVQEKTDGSFVGSDNSFGKEDVQKQTDGDFVGENTVHAQNTYFAGQSYQEQVGNLTDAPFAQESSNMDRQGVFLGEGDQKKTDGSFAGEDYGK